MEAWSRAFKVLCKMGTWNDQIFKVAHHISGGGRQGWACTICGSSAREMSCGERLGWKMRVGDKVCAIRDDEKMLNVSLEVNPQLRRKGHLLTLRAIHLLLHLCIHMKTTSAMIDDPFRFILSCNTMHHGHFFCISPNE
jgi:hypothetical protein